MSGTPIGAPGHRRARRVIGTALLTLSLLLVTACNESAQAHKAFFRKGGSTGGPVSAGPSALALAPAANASNVPVTDPVTVTAAAAVIDTVTLTDTQGKQVAGEFDAARHTWHATTPLGYNKTYTLAAAGTGSEGQHVTQSSQFSTVKPANLTLPYLRANGGLLLSDRPTFGVGQPIVVGFDEKVPDRAAAEKALEVVTEPHVDGAWHWFSDTEVHWRPQFYWKPGTKVTVRANVYGKDLGKGLYGQQDVSASFSIGPSKIAIADDKSFHIQVFVDGQMVRDVPTAMGMHASTQGDHGQYIDFRTRSGVHVVLGNERVTKMSSASFGLSSGPYSYNPENVEWTTHISYAGEYIHAAPWSVGQQGHSDASHGCLNVNTDNAIWFYNNFGPGDVVEVRNTGIDLDPTDGLGDWTLSWADWLKGSALPPPPPPPTMPLS
jgi:lipoprotein-anchoring transpeptidase ErfK/SrfK